MGANLDITACACERDPHLLVPELALELAYAQIMPELRSEPVGLAQANGRVLASPVIAAADGPPFDAAAMDGYALSTTDLSGSGPWLLPVAHRLAAGDCAAAHAAGTATQILTGAPIPTDADVVGMQEDVTVCRGSISLEFRPKAGAHICSRGMDIRQGAELLRPGALIGPREIAVAAAAGASALRVRPRGRVADLVEI